MKTSNQGIITYSHIPVCPDDVRTLHHAIYYILTPTFYTVSYELIWTPRCNNVSACTLHLPDPDVVTTFHHVLELLFIAAATDQFVADWLVTLIPGTTVDDSVLIGRRYLHDGKETR